MNDIPKLELLLQRGADINMTDDFNRNVLFYCNDFTVRVLLEAGAKIESTDIYGDTVLSRAVAASLDITILTKGSLHQSARRRGAKKVDLMMWFLAYGADATWHNGRNQSLLQIAAAHRKDLGPLVTLLLYNATRGCRLRLTDSSPPCSFFRFMFKLHESNQPDLDLLPVFKEYIAYLREAGQWTQEPVMAIPIISEILDVDNAKLAVRDSDTSSFEKRFREKGRRLHGLKTMLFSKRTQ